jgi:RNA polymerase sigma factor (sigma-70 family)
MEHPRPLNPDQVLVDAVLADAPGAFERLVGQYQGLCWHIIYRMVRQPEDARDLCQETFLRVHQCLHQYRYESALKSWIGQVAYSIALRYLRRRRIPLLEPVDDDGLALVENLGDGFDLETASADAQAAEQLHAAIDTLPPLQRTLLTLYHLDELSIPEIAAITGLAAGTIKSHLFRTRLRLRVLLESRVGVSA